MGNIRFRILNEDYVSLSRRSYSKSDFIQRHKKTISQALEKARTLILFAKAQLGEEQ